LTEKSDKTSDTSEKHTAKKTKKKSNSSDFSDTFSDSSDIKRFTDKMYCADCNITYPEFTPQHFSPNRQE